MFVIFPRHTCGFCTLSSFCMPLLETSCHIFIDSPFTRALWFKMFGIFHYVSKWQSNFSLSDNNFLLKILAFWHNVWNLRKIKYKEVVVSVDHFMSFVNYKFDLYHHRLAVFGPRAITSQFVFADHISACPSCCNCVFVVDISFDPSLHLSWPVFF